MPVKYRITTDQGTYHVTLDREPDSEEQLRGLVQAHFATMPEFSAPSTSPSTPARPSAAGGATQVPTATEPSAVSAVAEPFLRAGRALVQTPLAVARGLAAVGDVDWADVARHPGQLVTAAAETGKQLAPAVLPAVGAAVGSLAGPGGTAAGLVGGSLANSAIEQLVTGQPKKPLETLTEAATLPITTAIMGGTGRLVRAVPKRLPGAGAALQEESAAVAKGIPGSIKTTPSGPLYAAYEQAGSLPVTTTNLNGALGRLYTKEGQIVPALQEPQIAKVVNDLADVVTNPKVPVTLEQLRLNLSRAGATARALEESNPEVAGALKLLFREGWKDIEAAATQGGPQAQLLKTANLAYRREMAQETLKDWIEGTPTRKGAVNIRAADNLVSFSPGKITDQIRRDDFFRGSLMPEELKQIDDILQQLAKTPALPPVHGQMYGFGRLGTHASVGVLLARLLGTDVLTTTALTTVAGGIISRALMTPAGRGMLMSMTKRGPFLTTDQLGMLGAVVGTGSLVRND